MTLVASASAAPIDCETAVQRLWDYLDGRLAPGMHAEVEAHLAACAVCPPHFDFARRIQHALGTAVVPSVDPDEARLRERVRSALQRAGGPDAIG